MALLILSTKCWLETLRYPQRPLAAVSPCGETRTEDGKKRKRTLGKKEITQISWRSRNPFLFGCCWLHLDFFPPFFSAIVIFSRSSFYGLFVCVAPHHLSVPNLSLDQLVSVCDWLLRQRWCMQPCSGDSLWAEPQAPVSGLVQAPFSGSASSCIACICLFWVTVQLFANLDICKMCYIGFDLVADQIMFPLLLLFIADV